MRIFGTEPEPKMEKCPVCGKSHAVVNPLPKITVLLCERIIPDLIYTGGVNVSKETRELVKEALFGK